MQQSAIIPDQIAGKAGASDTDQQLTDPVQLVAAFEQFGRLSDQLQQSYNELDKRAAELTEQLASAQTERLKQLAEKEQLAHHLETLLNALPAGVLLIDDKGIIQTANPAAERLFEQVLTGTQWCNVYAKSVAKHTEQDLHLNSGRILSLKSQSLQEQGFVNSEGEIILLDDVTEQRLFEGLANRESRLAAMGQMAAGLAHQLRTPLASAILYASQLNQLSCESSKNNNRMHKKAAEKVSTCLRYLEKLINDMLMYAKGGEFSEQQFFLDELLVEFTTRIEQQLKQNSAKLAIKSRLNDIKLTGSVDALVSVLINLAENAIQACSKNKCKLEIDVYRQADYLVLAMRDNGPGLSVDQQSKIFQPFFTRREGGTGLGLSVAQSIVQAHHGDLLVRSQPGNGSIFYTCLPLNRNEQFLASGQAAGVNPEHLVNKCMNGESI
ncbi:MAG TPA: GHKL domain-containing protein [Gammaproteobacteria bacterium]|nr:GHKL domain-containing protein [Gammaproteobacteria bacterium]